MAEGLDNLKHIVVLMMENRSFDHMLGFAKSATWPIDGLAGTETNKDSVGGVAQVSSDSGYAGDFTPDPGHAGFDVLTQFYGDAGTSVLQEPNMSGFVRSYEGKNLKPQDAHRIMKCFSPQTLPVLTRLAQQFCVCDRWFSSVPGPTFPNRAFMHGATSIGRVDMGIDWRNMSTTIYERLAQNKIDSVIYYHDSTMASTFNGLAGNLDFFGSFDDDFLAACDGNDLPPYSFLEPRFANSAGGNGQPAFSASDQHPDHDVKEGEALIQTVFNAVWKNTKVRNSTLLVIVYDEHGGLYDHVAPPTTVNPDGKVWAGDPATTLDPPFDFTRLGVRVPAVLISPYIAAGTIDHRVYDHSSIIATALKHLIPNVANANLTLRDKLANTFEDNLSLQQPRTDKIDLGAGAKSQPPTSAQLAQPINDHLKAQVQQTAMMERTLPPNQRTGIDSTTITKESQAAAYLNAVYAKLHPKGSGQAGTAGSNK
jgi:phospholipase C